MNKFDITVDSASFYTKDNYGAPVVVVDNIKLQPKTLSYQMSAQASIDVLKDIASKELAKTIIESMNHTSISDFINNSHYERFSFTYAGKDELDVLKQQLDTRTEQYLSANDDLQKTEEYLKYITDKYMKAQKQVKFQYVVIGILSASILSFIISTLGSN